MFRYELRRLGEREEERGGTVNEKKKISDSLLLGTLSQALLCGSAP